MIYTIPHDPVGYSTLRVNRQPGWDATKQAEFNARNSLSNQLHPNAMYSSPITLDITFYLAVKKKTHSLPNPSIVDLVRFVEEMGTGILWPNSRIITCVNARKLLSQTPYTLIEVTKVL